MDGYRISYGLQRLWFLPLVLIIKLGSILIGISFYRLQVEAASSLISISSKTFATAIGNVHSSVENINDILV
jgi:hypothetical protein